ncbi:MAG: hypothetical protein L0H23_11735, partial [Luteimonas sp.]|nr:hypothetical protein [Luteimonas sp.]
MHKTALLSSLIAAGLLAGCGGDSDSTADATAPVGDTMEAPTRGSAAAAVVAAPADFEGTLQQVVI